MAKEGASMYILPIALVEYRISKEQVSTRHSQEQQLSAYNIRKGLLEYLLSQEGEHKDALQLYFHGLCGMVQAGLLSLEELFQQIYIVLIREKNIIH